MTWPRAKDLFPMRKIQINIVIRLLETKEFELIMGTSTRKLVNLTIIRMPLAIMLMVTDLTVKLPYEIL